MNYAPCTQDKDWTNGMADTMMKNLDHVAYRFMIIDDSGSMSIFDGNLYMVAPNGKGKMVKSSRWQELVQAINFHAEFADIAQAPTEFRFLNSSGPIVVGDSADDDGRARAHLTKVLSGGPSGGTPLCKQVTEIANKVRMMAPELKQRGQLASVTIFTDGQSSDGGTSHLPRPHCMYLYALVRARVTGLVCQYQH